MKRLLLSIFYLIITSSLFAQQEYSVFTAAGRGVSTTFVTDYQAIGINPANLGFKRTHDSKHITFGLMEIGASAYSAGLTKSNLMQAIGSYNSGSFTYQQKLAAAGNFANKPLAINADVNLFGIAVQLDKLGGLAFGVRESFRYYSSFSQQASDILFRGYGSSYFDTLYLNNGGTVANTPDNYAANENNISYGKRNIPLKLSQIYNGSKIQMQHYREYNLSYGKEFALNDNISLGVGIGLKYLQGFAVVDASANGSTFTATSAFSPSYGINFGSASKSNPSADSSKHGYPPKAAGHGYGTDFGLNLVIREKLKIGMSVTNIGSINYITNVYSVKDTTFSQISNSGVNSYNIVNQFETISSSNGVFSWKGNQNIKIKLPTMVRLGGSLKLGEKGEVGVDVLIPATKTPGSFQKIITSVGADLRVLRWIKLSGGIVHGGNFSSRVTIPLGVTLVVGENGTWELGVASRDAVTFFRNSGPAMSVALGFLRFRI